jgi:hypothetical protein
MGASSSQAVINVQIYHAAEHFGKRHMPNGGKLQPVDCLLPAESYGEHTVAAHFDVKTKKWLVCVIGATNIYARVFDNEDDEHENVFAQIEKKKGFYMGSFGPVCKLSKVYKNSSIGFSVVLDEVNPHEIYSYYVRHCSDLHLGALFRYMITREGLTDGLE